MINISYRRIHSEEEKARLETRIDEAKAERDAALAEGEELRVQINVAEDRNDSLQHQLQDTARRLKECKLQISITRVKQLDIRSLVPYRNIIKLVRRLYLG